MLIFNTTSMRQHDGGVHSPAIALQIGELGDSVTALSWLPGALLRQRLAAHRTLRGTDRMLACLHLLL